MVRAIALPLVILWAEFKNRINLIFYRIQSEERILGQTLLKIKFLKFVLRNRKKGIGVRELLHQKKNALEQEFSPYRVDNYLTSNEIFFVDANLEKVFSTLLTQYEDASIWKIRWNLFLQRIYSFLLQIPFLFILFLYGTLGGRIWEWIMFFQGMEIEWFDAISSFVRTLEFHLNPSHNFFEESLYLFSPTYYQMWYRMALMGFCFIIPPSLVLSFFAFNFRESKLGKLLIECKLISEEEECEGIYDSWRENISEVWQSCYPIGKDILRKILLVILYPLLYLGIIIGYQILYMKIGKTTDRSFFTKSRRKKSFHITTPYKAFCFWNEALQMLFSDGSVYYNWKNLVTRHTNERRNQLGRFIPCNNNATYVYAGLIFKTEFSVVTSKSMDEILSHILDFDKRAKRIHSIYNLYGKWDFRVYECKLWLTVADKYKEIETLTGNSDYDTRREALDIVYYFIQESENRCTITQ